MFVYCTENCQNPPNSADEDEIGSDNDVVGNDYHQTLSEKARKKEDVDSKNDELPQSESGPGFNLPPKNTKGKKVSDARSRPKQKHKERVFVSQNDYDVQHNEEQMMSMLRQMNVRSGPGARCDSEPPSGTNVALGYRVIDDALAKFYPPPHVTRNFGDLQAVADDTSLRETRNRKAAFYGNRLMIQMSSGRSITAQTVHQSQKRKDDKKAKRQEQTEAKRNASKSNSNDDETDAMALREAAQREHVRKLQESAGPDTVAPRRSSRLARQRQQEVQGVGTGAPRRQKQSRKKSAGKGRSKGRANAQTRRKTKR